MSQLLFASIRRVMDDSVAPRLRRSADGRKSGRVFATRSTTSYVPVARSSYVVGDCYPTVYIESLAS